MVNSKVRGRWILLYRTIFIFCSICRVHLFYDLLQILLHSAQLPIYTLGQLVAVKTITTQQLMTSFLVISSITQYGATAFSRRALHLCSFQVSVVGGGQGLLLCDTLFQGWQDLLQLCLLRVDEIQFTVQPLLLTLHSLHLVIQLSNLHRVTQ